MFLNMDASYGIVFWNFFIHMHSYINKSITKEYNFPTNQIGLVFIGAAL